MSIRQEKCSYSDKGKHFLQWGICNSNCYPAMMHQIASAESDLESLTKSCEGSYKGKEKVSCKN